MDLAESGALPCRDSDEGPGEGLGRGHPGCSSENGWQGPEGRPALGQGLWGWKGPQEASQLWG